jgi:hypothetical protein
MNRSYRSVAKTDEKMTGHIPSSGSVAKPVTMSDTVGFLL